MRFQASSQIPLAIPALLTQSCFTCENKVTVSRPALGLALRAPPLRWQGLWQWVLSWQRRPFHPATATMIPLHKCDGRPSHSRPRKWWTREPEGLLMALQLVLKL